MKMTFLLATALLSASVVAAQGTSLGAATRLMEVTMPVRRQTAMAESMVASYKNQSTASIVDLPEFSQLLKTQPLAKEALKRFESAVEADCRKRVIVSMPRMFSAMTRGYARRLTVQQMDELIETLSTPSGQAYMEISATIMNDSDMVAWQSALTTDAMADLPKHIGALEAELAALNSTAKAK
jgi:hypothetical protein